MENSLWKKESGDKWGRGGGEPSGFQLQRNQEQQEDATIKTFLLQQRPRRWRGHSQSRVLLDAEERSSSSIFITSSSSPLLLLQQQQQLCSNTSICSVRHTPHPSPHGPPLLQLSLSWLAVLLLSPVTRIQGSPLPPSVSIPHSWVARLGGFPPSLAAFEHIGQEETDLSGLLKVWGFYKAFIIKVL